MFVRFVCFCLVAVQGALAESEGNPALQLAVTYDHATKSGELDLKKYWVSEKLDGVRAYWDGERLVSKGGHEIHAPQWFADGLPQGVVMDGELWIARGKFELVSGAVRKKTPIETEWRKVKYCIFDLPAHPGVFDERVLQMRRVVAANKSSWLQVVEQFKVKDLAELQGRLDKLESEGGEGLMLHKGSARYQTRRTNDLVKFKPLDDAEALVVAHIEGKGKYQGMLGAMVLEMEDGKRFKVGSGFSDQERRNPPAVGATITYQHNGLTSNGIPRFARYMRVRKKL